MKQSFKTGLCFGLTSATITTLGLMTGLAAGTDSKATVIGGLVTIAIADAMSDALGIHISEESNQINSKGHIWEATLATFMAKFLFALTFIVPVLLFGLGEAVMISVVWGVLVLSIVSHFIAKAQGTKSLHVILEHTSIAIIVVFITHQVGLWTAAIFQ